MASDKAEQLVIWVTIKNVYGNERIYPACEKAELFARLTESKTLTDRAIGRIKDLGYTVEVKLEQTTL